MTSSLSSTGSISSAGVGSGLDVEGIVTKLMAIEQRPLTLLQRAATGIQTKISAYGALQSSLGNFRDASLALSRTTTFTGMAASSGDAGTASVTAGPTAVAGSYTLAVQNLAAAQSTASTAVSSTATVGAGTLHIDLGSWSGTPAGFAAASGNTGVDISVSATDTLGSVRDKINAASAGVSASIVSDASGARLIITSNTTGSANGFRVTAVDSDNNNTDAFGLSALAYDPAGGTTATTQTQAGANANATINGLPVNSVSNVLSNVVEGLTITLTKPTTSSVQLTVAQDAAGAKNAIQSFVAAYNSLATMLASDVKFDSGSSTAGVLQGDSTAVALQRQLRNMLGAPSSASSVFTTLSQVGLELQADGTLKVNDTKLNAAMGNVAEMKKLFTATDLSGGGQGGIARRLASFGDAALGVDGLLTGRTDGLNASLKTNRKSQDDMHTRLSSTEARMRAQYSALDTKMASLNALSAYMTQQITNWNKSSNNNN